MKLFLMPKKKRAITDCAETFPEEKGKVFSS